MKYSKILSTTFVFALTCAAAFGVQAASYKVVGETIPQSLTGKAGDPANGRAVAIHRQKGNCLACHQMPIPEQQFHGEVGPPLHDVGSRMKAGELRLRVVDPKVLDKDSIMPGFLNAKHNLAQKKWAGKSMLSAQEIEDVVAYLLTLKGSYTK
ncbi:MAG: sulfur oxidation c-type cytochrome SoxX [Rhodospirillales bacterium]|nr:sulfur oxidation c-type cytochrome SoxX [Rhodospirillales bacterium]